MNARTRLERDAWAHADAQAIEGILAVLAACAQPVRIGLCGPQGSGKSTMAHRLAVQLEGRGLRVALLSLDDFYLTRLERVALAARIHPLLATRGVPGTHDIELLTAILDQLAAAGPDAQTLAPRFDKALDDRKPAASWQVLPGRPDVVLLEGWCVGARPQPAAALAAPVNRLEAEKDPEGVWRGWVNERLGRDYASLFARLSYRIFLAAPDFDCVFGWRLQQEETLLRTSPGSEAMDRAALRAFIAHYERITRDMLADPPADLMIMLDAERVPVGCVGGPSGRAA